MLSLSGLLQLVQRNPSVVPGNEALIKSGYKPSFVVPYTCVSRQTQDMRKRLHAAHEPLLISRRRETKIQVVVNFDSIKVSLFLLIGFSKCNHNVCRDTTRKSL